MFHRVVVEADSVDQALERIQSEAPSGYEVLQTEVVSQPKSDTITSVAATSESALGKARHKVPKGAAVTEERELRQPGSEIVTVEALDEATARTEVEGRTDAGTTIQFLKLESEGSKGFWGIGKKPNRYKAQLFHPAVVCVSYRLNARVSATLMSGGAAEQARAAVQELVDLHDRAAAEVADPSRRSSWPNEQIRLIGHRLESLGGVDLMLAVHTLFSRERPRAQRALEQAWDGIGAWIA